MQEKELNKNIAKKTIILYVLKIIYNGSSKEKPITIKQITNVINALGVPCDRKTVSRNLEYMMEFGLPVYKIRGGGCYYNHNKPEMDLFQIKK